MTACTYYILYIYIFIYSTLIRKREEFILWSMELTYFSQEEGMSYGHGMRYVFPSPKSSFLLRQKIKIIRNVRWIYSKS